jgi:hypothetical protein
MATNSRDLLPIQDAIASCKSAAIGIESATSALFNGGTGGKMGGVEQLFLTYYAGLMRSRGFTLTSENVGTNLLLQQIDLSPILDALYRARIRYLCEGYSNVIIAPIYKESGVSRDQLWRSLSRPLDLNAEFSGAQVLGITSNYSQVIRREYLINAVAKTAAEEKAEEGRVHEDYLVEFSPIPISIDGAIAIDNFVSPLESFRQALRQLDEDQIPLLIESERTSSQILVKGAGLDQYAKAKPDEYRELMAKLTESYLKMRSNGIFFADSNTEVQVVNHPLDGLEEVTKVLLNRIAAEADGIPGERLWNSTEKSGGLNTSDRATMQENSRLEQISPPWIEGIRKWATIWLSAKGIKSPKFEIKLNRRTEASPVAPLAQS